MSNPQLIHLVQPLPCGLMTETGICGQPTTAAYIAPDTTDTVPDDGGYFRLLPICKMHLAELTSPPILISDLDQAYSGRTTWEWE